MAIRCSDQCDESHEASIFKVTILVDEERAVVSPFHGKDVKEFRCAHCDAVAEEDR